MRVKDGQHIRNHNTVTNAAAEPSSKGHGIAEWCEQFAGVLRKGTTEMSFAEPGKIKFSGRTKVRELGMEKRRMSIQGRENHPCKDEEKPGESSQSPNGAWQIRMDKKATVRPGPWVPS